MKIGICGLGIVGSAIYNFFTKDPNVELYFYDKYKYDNNKYDNYKYTDTIDILMESEILYICLPTLYDETLKSYNMEAINSTIDTLNNMKYTGIIIIKSTVLPDYIDTLNCIYKDLIIIYNPEFLSAKTANEDFANQHHIILGYTEQSKEVISLAENFYKIYFPNATISITTAKEAIITKLACNSFYAVKVQFFTEIYLLCQNNNINYDNIKKMMLMNGWINSMHCNIPGPDKNISYGGMCLPKDIMAFNEYLKSYEIPNNVIDSTIIERNSMRD